MKRQDENNQSIINTTLFAQKGQAQTANTLNDLPVNEAQAAEVKGGPVTIEYLSLGDPLAPRPAGTVTTRP